MAIVDITVEQIFGDGLVWAGIVMMALLGQQKRWTSKKYHFLKICTRFECFDFCYHILRVQRINEIDENFKGDDDDMMMTMMMQMKVMAYTQNTYGTNAYRYSFRRYFGIIIIIIYRQVKG